MTVLRQSWKLGFNDRGLGHGDFGIITAGGKLVIPELDRELAEHIIDLHNKGVTPMKFNDYTATWFDKLVEYRQSLGDVTRHQIVSLERYTRRPARDYNLENVEVCVYEFPEMLPFRNPLLEHIHAIKGNTFQKEFRYKYSDCRRRVSCVSNFFSSLNQALNYGN